MALRHRILFAALFACGDNDGKTPNDPDDAELTCAGRDGPQSGACCENLYCYDPADGAECPDYDVTLNDAITGQSLGSGTCSCDGGAGPVDPTEFPEAPESEGACCYVVGLQACTGRPMLVGGFAVRATLVDRAWS